MLLFHLERPDSPARGRSRIAGYYDVCEVEGKNSPIFSLPLHKHRKKGFILSTAGAEACGTALKTFWMTHRAGGSPLARMRIKISWTLYKEFAFYLKNLRLSLLLL